MPKRCQRLAAALLQNIPSGQLVLEVRQEEATHTVYFRLSDPRAQTQRDQHLFAHAALARELTTILDAPLCSLHELNVYLKSRWKSFSFSVVETHESLTSRLRQHRNHLQQQPGSYSLETRDWLGAFTVGIQIRVGATTLKQHGYAAVLNLLDQRSIEEVVQAYHKKEE